MSKDLPAFKKEEIVLNLVFKDPRKGSHSLSALLPQIDKKPMLSNRGVYLVLQKFDLTTAKKRTAFVRLERRLGRENAIDVLANWSPKTEKLTSAERLTMILRAKDGEPVKALCRAFGVSRKTFYKWQKRFNEVLPSAQKLVLTDKAREVKRYWRQVSLDDEQKVLQIVLSQPELSAHRIIDFLPQVAGKPLIGNHGVQNVLRRHHLTTLAARLAYQKTREAIRPVTLPSLANVFHAPLRALRMALAPFATVPKSSSFGLLIGVFFTVFLLSTSIRLWLTMFSQAPATAKPGLIFATVSLICGSVFFLYSLKYYLTLALVLGFSRHVGEPENGHDNNSQSFWLERFLGHVNSQGTYKGGLQPNLSNIKLARFPFVSIHLPLYNERKVVDRLLTACTSLDYPNFEVIVVDDSTDATTQILKDWQNHPRVKVIHRDSREGFKGGALKVALEKTDPRTEFVLIFDADFVPYPDTISQFLKYFQSITGTLDFSGPGSSQVAAIQGYQWHVLNKSENWITRGVRSEYAGSYLVERSGAEVLGALKQIAGSVYMVRKDVLDKFGWQTSITEDFQLTLRLYEQGYKVIYTPYIQAPSECVSTVTRLIRQRMRWAEGHSYNIKKHFWRLLTSGKATGMEKVEFLYLSPYYLQAFFFLVGTLAWIISETVLRARLPFWTALWGWSLVLTNMFALPLMNTVGLFLEESEERDYLGIFSFVGLSYLLVPFQAYASLKGFLEKEEGPWFRTPKTGKITDIFTRGKFYRWLSGIIPGTRPAYNGASQGNPYLALATANNQFDNFGIKQRKAKWLGKVILVFLLTISITVYSLTYQVSEVYASPDIFYFDPTASLAITTVTAGQLNTGTPGAKNVNTCAQPAANTTGAFELLSSFAALSCNTAAEDETLHTPDSRGLINDSAYSSGVIIPTGTWSFRYSVTSNSNCSAGVANLHMNVYKVSISGGQINTSTFLFHQSSASDMWTGADFEETVTVSPNPSQVNFDDSEKYLYVELFANVTTGCSQTTASRRRLQLDIGTTACSTVDCNLTSPTVQIPENVLLLLLVAPFIPAMTFWLKRKKEGKVLGIR